LDIIIGKGSTIFELLSSENQSLLLWRDAFFILDFRLDILDGVVWLDVQGDSLASQRFDEDLHSTTTKTKDKMQRGFFLNVVVGKSPAIFKLLSSKNEALLLRWDSFLVLDFRLDVLDGVIWLDVKGDRFTGQGLDEDLHGTTS